MSAPALRDDGPGFGLYVHWPFCRSKCPYCDFNSHVRHGIDQTRWREALLAELDHYADATPGRTLSSIFFGGGTPSLMPPDTAAAVIERARARWGFAPGIEITLEANPTSVEAARFRALAEAGVNRVSLGVQALDDTALAFLGRQHTAAEALAAVRLAAATFPRWSLDLIYARPGQTEAAWRDELGRALAEAGDHLSVYQLIVEEGTAFHTLHRAGKLVPMDDDAAADLYEATQAMLDGAGFPAYEISNHARAGGACRHNLIYWAGGEWAGIGPGAHGRLDGPAGRLATRQARLPEAWLDAVRDAGHATRECRPLAGREIAEEMLMMGLRLAEGIGLARLERTSGLALAEIVDLEDLAPLVEAGMLALDDSRLRATAVGRQRLDAVLGRLMADG